MDTTRALERPSFRLRASDVRDDGALVAAAVAGETAAFGVLVKRHQQKTFAVALGIVRDRDDARDLCQEAFLRAYRNLARFSGQAQFFTWLYRIVFNLCIDHLRRRRAEEPLSDATLERDADAALASIHRAPDPSEALVADELRGRLDRALAELPAIHRAVLVLRDVRELSYKEIASVLECPIGTVMSRLFHARRRMQRLLLLDEPAALPLRRAA